VPASETLVPYYQTSFRNISETAVLNIVEVSFILLSQSVVNYFPGSVVAFGPQGTPAKIKMRRYRTGVLRLYTKRNDKGTNITYLVF
jgi:hypothetical protein